MKRLRPASFVMECYADQKLNEPCELVGISGSGSVYDILWHIAVKIETTRVTQAPSCPSRRWSGAGVGIGMLRGRGWFLVSWCLGFLVSWFRSFLVSKFLGFKASKIYKIICSCFLEDTDPISKIFKILLNGSSGLVGARLFQN